MESIHDLTSEWFTYVPKVRAHLFTNMVAFLIFIQKRRYRNVIRVILAVSDRIVIHVHEAIDLNPKYSYRNVLLYKYNSTNVLLLRAWLSKTYCEPTKVTIKSTVSQIYDKTVSNYSYRLKNIICGK